MEYEKLFVTDRYIPSRKLLNKDSLFQQEEDLESIENFSQQPCESDNFQVSDIYKKYIMTEGNTNK